MPCIPHLTVVCGPLLLALPRSAQRLCMRSARVLACGQCALSAAASVWPHMRYSACPQIQCCGHHQYGLTVHRCMCARKRPQQRGNSGVATDSLPRPSLLPFHIRLIAQSLDKLPFTSPPLSFAALVLPQCAALPLQNIRGLTPFR